MINKSDIVTNTEVLNCVKCSDHRMVRATLRPDLHLAYTHRRKVE